MLLKIYLMCPWQKYLPTNVLLSFILVTLSLTDRLTFSLSDSIPQATGNALTSYTITDFFGLEHCLQHLVNVSTKLKKIYYKGPDIFR